MPINQSQIRSALGTFRPVETGSEFQDWGSPYEFVIGSFIRSSRWLNRGRRAGCPTVERRRDDDGGIMAIDDSIEMLECRIEVSGPAAEDRALQRC